MKLPKYLNPLHWLSICPKPSPPFYRGYSFKLLPPSYYWYHIRKWLHWEFGLHRYKVLDDKKVWCNFCGGYSTTFRELK